MRYFEMVEVVIGDYSSFFKLYLKDVFEHLLDFTMAFPSHSKTYLFHSFWIFISSSRLYKGVESDFVPMTNISTRQNALYLRILCIWEWVVIHGYFLIFRKTVSFQHVLYYLSIRMCHINSSSYKLAIKISVILS